MGLSLKNTFNKTDAQQITTTGTKKSCVATLTRDQYDLWDALVSISPHGTVFHYSWWLAATGSEFEILGYWGEAGNLIGGIPLPFKKKAGLTLYHSPLL